MSHIMEKTLASLPKLLSQSLIGGGNSKMTSQRQPPSTDVQQFMRQIHKARSRSQEAAIVKSQLLSMKEKLKATDLTPNVVRGCLTKIIFCYQLGYDMSEMAIEPLKFANQGRGCDKRLGYLVACLLLHSRHELTILMTSTIMKDLSSSSMMENCLALEVAGELMGAYSIPFILDEVVRKFTHQQDLVKEKALHCFRCFYQKAPELLEHYIPRLNVFLASRDPGILIAVINMFVILTAQKPSRFVGLAPSFMHILNQINSRGFGSIYYYHMVALPWLQISLLKILSNLAQVDSHISNRLEPMLKTLIEKTKVSVPISLALLVESIQTATKIQASESLLQLCSRCIMKLMASDSSEDMRYQGLGLLISLSKIKPSYAGQHQAAVMECLSSDDPAIQSRTTFLLYAMANSANIKIISEKLFDQHEKSNDHDFRKEILEMITDLIEKLAVDIEWCVNTTFRVLSHSHGVLDFKDRVVDSLLKKVEQCHYCNAVEDSGGLTNILEMTLSILENETHITPETVVRIQLLGVVVPLVPHLLQAERFFDIITPLIFNADVCDTNAKSNQVLMNPPGQFTPISSGNKACDLIHNNEEIRMRLTCVEIIMKLVLAECLDYLVVHQWLEKNDYKGRISNGFLSGILRELEDLVMQPSAIKGKSKIIFRSQLSDLDMSLSFLDPLVVQDLLNGGACYKPKYAKQAGKVSHDLTLSATTLTKSNSNHDDDLLSLTNSLPADGKRPSASKRGKGRWRDNDEDANGDSSDEDDVNKLLFFSNAEASINAQEADKSKKDLAEQLFAGLDYSNSTEPSNSPSDSGISNSSTKGLVKSQKSMWDDDDDDDDDGTAVCYQNNSERKSSFFGMDLHPFGLSKKISPKSIVWCDDSDSADSLQTDRESNTFALKSSTLIDQSAETSLYDPADSPSYAPTYLYHKADTDSLDCPVIQTGLSIEQETGLSIYSEFIDGQSPVLVSPDITMSTVDTLTDSDPEGT